MELRQHLVFSRPVGKSTGVIQRIRDLMTMPFGPFRILDSPQDQFHLAEGDECVREVSFGGSTQWPSCFSQVINASSFTASFWLSLAKVKREIAMLPTMLAVSACAIKIAPCVMHVAVFGKVSTQKRRMPCVRCDAPELPDPEHDAVGLLLLVLDAVEA
jgi:hypothetical protein